MDEEFKEKVNYSLNSLLQNLTVGRILSRLIKEKIFFEFAAPKFGGIEKYSYICTKIATNNDVERKRTLYENT